MANGVEFYSHGVAHIYFANGNKCCDLCPMLETYSRKQCRLTGEYLSSISTNCNTGGLCPIEIVTEGANNGIQNT